MKKETIVLGGGCFWCLEAIYQRIPEILKVTSGYAGGSELNPTYEMTSSGNTGHAEVVEIEFDSEKISLEKIFQIFFISHDPTTVDRQGNDIGTQYRSIILYTDESQEEIVMDSINNAQKEFDDKIVTEVKHLEKFYEAEDSHKDYYSKNKNNSYCRFVIQPKLDRVLKAK